MIYERQILWYTHAANQANPFFRRKTKMKLFQFMKHSGNREEMRQDAKVRCYVCINGIIMPVL